MRDEPAGATTAAPGGAIDQAGELRSSRIESLRAVAALGVLLGHIFVSTHPGVADDTFLNRVVLGSGFGVFLFFTLSGYLLFWPFAKRDFAGAGRVHLRRYALNRALRILPLYYVVLVVLLLAQEDGGTARQWLVFGSFGENFFADTVSTVDGVMWSLVVELHFYALLPLIALGLAAVARGSLRRAAIALGLLGGLSLALRTATVTFADAPNPHIQYSILTLFFFFVSGMALALARIHLERDGARRLRGPLATSDAWILGGVAVWLVVCWRYRLDSALAVGGFLLVGACVLPLRAGRLVRAIEWRPLAAIGVVSYSLYLWHGPFSEFLYGGSLEDERFAEVLVVAGPLCVLVAFASYRLVEAPFLRLRRSWSRSRLAGGTARSSGRPGEDRLVGHAVPVPREQATARTDS